jgi:5'(3')-deoxyribonucleotidase
MRIAVDVDDVVLDALSEWLATFRQHTGFRLYPFEATSWNLNEFVPVQHQLALWEARTPALYERVEAIRGAKEGCNELIAQGHSLVFVSTDTAPYARPKFEALKRVLGWEPQLVFTGHKKNVVPADISIDDGLHNEPTILFTQPWNAAERGYNLRAPPLAGRCGVGAVPRQLSAPLDALRGRLAAVSSHLTGMVYCSQQQTSSGAGSLV